MVLPFFLIHSLPKMLCPKSAALKSLSMERVFGVLPYLITFDLPLHLELCVDTALC